MINLETVNTYEGTHDVHALILPCANYLQGFVLICQLLRNEKAFQIFLRLFLKKPYWSLAQGLMFDRHVFRSVSKP
jgi:hypothetical protein